MTQTRDACAALDAADPLAAFRDRFVVGDDAAIYANGNSLGRPPRATAPRVAGLIDEWGGALTAGWKYWVDLPTEVGDRLGEACLGAAPGQVAIADSTSVNLYKAVVAALDAAAPRSALVVAAEEFPTDRYVLQSIAAARGAELRTVARAADIPDACADGAAAVAVASLVHYRSGELLDLGGVTATLRTTGTTMVWDLSHAVGVVDVRLDDAGVDVAVGCTYKYLNGGPGAPAFIYVSRDAQARLRQPMWGWFGNRDMFAMGPEYVPAPTMRSWLVGTPNIAATMAVDEGVRVVAEAGIGAVRDKSKALTSAAYALAESWLVPLGAVIDSPAEPERRGSHIAIAHPDAAALCNALIAKERVVPDFRHPNVIRLGLSPLYTRFVDVWDALDRTREEIEHPG